MNKAETFLLFQTGSSHTGAHRPVRQTGSRQPIHLQRGERQMDQERAKVSGSGHQ